MHASRSPRILASVRSADRTRLAEEVAALHAAGIDGLHVDVMDGDFVAETCFEPGDVARLRELGSGLVDVHLIARAPDRLLQDYAAAGAHRIAFHLEAADRPGDLLDALEVLGVGAGIVVLPSTPMERTEPWLDRVAVVNPLGVDPTRGLGFQESTFERIAWLSEVRARRGLGFAIQADGGVWEKTRDGLVEAGADELVGGYPIFSQPDYAAAIEALRRGAPA